MVFDIVDTLGKGMSIIGIDACFFKTGKRRKDFPVVDFTVLEIFNVGALTGF